MGSSNNKPAAAIPAAARAERPGDDDDDDAGFVVSVKLPHKRLQLALPHTHHTRPTVAHLQREVARREGVPIGLLLVRVRGKEVRSGDQPLERGVEYDVVAFPIFRDLARLTDDEGDDHNDGDGDGDLPKLLAELCRDRGPGVHLWRMSSCRSKRKWVDLVVEGPAFSPYDGGAFVLRVEDEEHEIMGCAYHHLTLRMLTPLYHPTVGPNGVVALWLHQEWDRRQGPWKTVSAFVEQLSLDVPPIFHQSMQKQLPPMQHMLKEWTVLGPAGVEAKARLWTWHYATAHGRAYRRSGRRCSGLAMLASLIEADPQARSLAAFVRSEVRQVLLAVNRPSADGEEDFDANAIRPLLARLPTELLRCVLLAVGSGRQPPPPPPNADWALARDDDGLPLDWPAAASADIP